MAPPTHHRKRRRTVGTRDTATAVAWNGLFAVVGCSLVGVSNAASPYVGSCVVRLQEAAPNNQTIVSTADYGQFLSGLSGGLVADFESSPSSLQDPFLNHGSVETGIDLSTIDEEQATSICVDVFQGLFEVNDVVVTAEECITYLKDTDIDAENGQLEKNEYPSFLDAMATDLELEFAGDFDQLPRLPQEAYSDFSIDGVIQGAEGPDYLYAFCTRSLLAVRATDAASSLKQTTSTQNPNATLAPSASATSIGTANGTVSGQAASDTPSPSAMATNGTLADQLTDGTLSPSMATTSGATTQETTAPTPIPTVVSTSVGTVATTSSGSNSNQQGDDVVNGASPTPASTSANTEAPVTTTAPPTSGSSGSVGTTLLPTIGSTGSTESPTLSGPDVTLIPTAGSSGETTRPTTLGGATILPTTLESLPGGNNDTGSVVPTPRLTYSPTVSPTILETTVSPTGAPTDAALSLKAFNTCKIGLIVSDINRNDRLEPQEFVRLVHRLAGDPTSATPLYAELDPIYQSTYEVLQGEESEPGLEGTKPGRVATPEQRENILWICRQTYAAIEQYEEMGPTDTDGNSTSATDGSDADDEFTPEFKSQCNSAIIIADLNRDNMLNEDEYVRFITRLSPDIFHRATAFPQLDPRFKASYHQVASAHGITVAGSKPGQLSTTTQRQHLDSVCRAANTAIRTIEKNGGVLETVSPTRSPVLAQGSSAVETEYFRSCKTAMLIADLDRDDSLSQTEFVRLLNRLTISEFSGMTFESLDPVLQLAFYKIADDKSAIDVSGSKPGEELDGETLTHLQGVCDSVRKSLVAFDAMEAQAPTPTAPVAPPVVTPVPTKSPIGFDVVGDCRQALVDADRDRNFLVSEVEFIGFVNAWRSEQSSAFDELPLSFRNGFGIATGKGEAIDLGATNGAALERFCLNVVSQGERLINEDCRPSLYSADIDANNRLDQEEYVYFLELFGDLAASEFDGLPYVLRDNWDSIVLEREYVDVSGITADFGAENIGHKIRLDFICQRTELAFSAIRAGRDAAGLEDNCVDTLTEADGNGDQFIDSEEYLVLVALLSGSSLTGKFFDSLPNSFLNAFDVLKDPDLEMIDVETSAVNGVCFELESATVDSRVNEAFFEQCVVSFQYSDENRDDFVDENEYIQLLYSLAVAFGYANRMPGNFSFEDLNEVLQLNFEVLSQQETASISIQGWQTPGMLTRDMFDNLQWVCQNMHDVARLVSSSEDSSIVAYNSFIISNEDGLDAGLVQSSVAWDALELAYASLVREQVSLLKAERPPRLRRRKLGIDGVDENDINLYYIEETRCAGDLPDETKCQVVFGSVKLLISDEGDPESAADHYAQTVQDAIDAGALQLKLLLVEASSPLKIEKSSTPLRPVDADLFLFGGTRAPLPTPVEDEGSMVLALVAGALVSLAIFLTFYYWFYYIRKTKGSPPKEQSKMDESDTYYPPDRTDKSGRSSRGSNEFSVQVLPLESLESKSKESKLQTSKANKVSTAKDSSESNSSSLSSHDFRALALQSSSFQNSKSTSRSKEGVSEVSDSSKSSSRSIQLKEKKQNEKARSAPRAQSEGSSKDGSSSSGSFGDFVTSAAKNSNSPDSSSDDESDGSFGDFVGKANSSGQSKTDDSNTNSVPDYLSKSPRIEVEREESNSYSTSLDEERAASNLAPKQNQSSTSFSDDDAEESSLSIEDDEEDEEASFDIAESSVEDMTNSIVSESQQEESGDDLNLGAERAEANDETVGSEDLEESASLSMDRDESASQTSEGEGSVEQEANEDEDPQANGQDEDSDADGTGASYDEAETLVNSTMSMNSKDAYKAYEMYRPIVEDLVRQVVPDEIDNIDTMMEQFIGRERELVRTLKNMAGMEDSSEDEFDDDSESEFYSDDDPDDDGSTDFDDDGSDDISDSASGSEED